MSSIIFGFSSLGGDIQDAIDDAFDKIVQIETNSTAECRLAEEQVFTTSLNEDAARTIKEFLIPQPGDAAADDTCPRSFPRMRSWP